MQYWKRLKIALFVTTAIAAAAPPMAALASDHIDSPTVAQDRAADIGDLWAFLDPDDNSQVVLIMSTQGFIVSGEHFGMPIFDHNLRYRFEIENTGDAKPDLFVDVTFSPGLGRQMPQTATIKLPNGHEFTASTTIATQEFKAPDFEVSTDPSTGVKFFAGVADDPFFLDDTGANRLVASALANPGHPKTILLGDRGGRDTYAGLNTLITAIRIPAAMLRGTGDVIGVNAVTQRHAVQTIKPNGIIETSGDWVTVDRDGNPLVNNGLIPAERKDEYNASTTEEDAAGKFKADIVKSLKAFDTNEEHIAMALKAVQENGDILRLDLTVPNKGHEGGDNKDGGFGKMGGRRLTDDVVDKIFTMINNGKLLSDHVDANDVKFENVFPFVAKPHQPTPPTKSADADDGIRQ